MDLEPFARLALACVRREYPSHISHLMTSDADARPPRELMPAFCGCFDWHSAVHGHWLLARFARLCPSSPLAAPAREALGQALQSYKILAELRYLTPRPTFERPYGLAWLLQLHAELSEWDDPDVVRWRESLSPLADLATTRLREWLPKLSHPVRSGVHSQTAFAVGLALDWARIVQDRATETLLTMWSMDRYSSDRDYALHLEPSGEDFLSPAFGAADLMRRLLDPEPFAAWLHRVLPAIPADASGDWLAPARVTDGTDGRLAHLDGLNLSRAWMLAAIARSLPTGDARIGALEAAGDAHRLEGLASVTGAPYEGAHWLGTFATYLATDRGWR